jgi:predicted RNase H-like HicB family nuclease
VNFKIEFDREDDGRWIAEIAELPGVLAYGATRDEAEAAVEALALRVIADQIETEKVGQKSITFTASTFVERCSC